MRLHINSAGVLDTRRQSHRVLDGASNVADCFAHSICDLQRGASIRLRTMSQAERLHGMACAPAIQKYSARHDEGAYSSSLVLNVRSSLIGKFLALLRVSLVSHVEGSIS